MLDTRERLQVARERLRKAERKAHPDVGELAGARADVTFYVRLSAWVAHRGAAGAGGPGSTRRATLGAL